MSFSISARLRPLSQSPLCTMVVRSGVEHLHGLLDIGLGVGLDLLLGERRAGGVAAGRVADERGAVADDERHAVAEILELAQLAQGHRMAQMDIGGRRVDAELHVQRHAALELLQERDSGTICAVPDLIMCSCSSGVSMMPPLFL